MCHYYELYVYIVTTVNGMDGYQIPTIPPRRMTTLDELKLIGVLIYFQQILAPAVEPTVQTLALSFWSASLGAFYLNTKRGFTYIHTTYIIQFPFQSIFQCIQFIILKYALVLPISICIKSPLGTTLHTAPKHPHTMLRSDSIDSDATRQSCELVITPGLKEVKKKVVVVGAGYCGKTCMLFFDALGLT